MKKRNKIVDILRKKGIELYINHEGNINVFVNGEFIGVYKKKLRKLGL